VRALVTDIEGTTSSISFVKDELFPYAYRALPDFVRREAARDDVTALVSEVRDIEGSPDLSLDGVIRRLLTWIEEDRKVPPLKALQGMVWANGYASGELRGHVYPDVIDALRRWHAANVSVYVYSSGSTEAQQLLFGHSIAGDLRPLFRGWFDTRVGSKLVSASYATIAAHIGVPPTEIQFLSDNLLELDAAAAAGFRTVQLARDGGCPALGSHPVARSFAEL
jgi:enolase-phosphatase E1